MIKLAIIDDHKIFREGLAQLLNGTGKNNVVYQGGNGLELKNHLESNVPNFELILLDINMPKMNGIDTAYFLSQNYPALKFIALSMYDDDKNIIAMIQNGACGYLPKDTSFEEVIKAIDLVVEEGYYYNQKATKALVKATHKKPETLPALKISDREAEFLSLACSELTYKEISDLMHVSAKTVEGYRESLFNKLQVKSRVGMVILAISNSWIKL